MFMVTEASSLLLLLNWMSPTFPIGGFAYSHGLEQAIADGRIKSADDVEHWIADLITQGSGWTDAVLFAKSWTEDCDGLNELALAMSGSAERYQETTQLGQNFSVAASVWGISPVAPHPPSGHLLPIKGSGEDKFSSLLPPFPAGEGGRRPDEGLRAMAYPIAAGTVCCRAGLDPHTALLAYIQNFCASLVSVAVRLIPLGQTNGLIVLRNLATHITATVDKALDATIDDIGGCCIAADIAAMKHETLEPRIFRT